MNEGGKGLLGKEKERDNNFYLFEEDRVPVVLIIFEWILLCKVYSAAVM